MLAAVIKKQGLGAALAFVVAGTDTDRVHVAPVAFRLRMHCRIAVDLAGRRLQDTRAGALGQAQHVDRAVHAGLGGLHRVALVVDRRCRTGQVVDPVHFHVQRKGHIVAHQFEIRVFQQVHDVTPGAGVEIIDAQHIMAFGQQAVTQVGAKKAGATGDQNSKGRISFHWVHPIHCK